MSGPTLQQPMLDWKAPDKYHKSCNFEMEVRTIFLTSSYNIQESEKSK